MATVLIPSDNPYFLSGLVRGYRAHGHQVVLGAINYRHRSIDVDLVHYQWPEEFCYGREPSEARLKEIEADLDDWATRACCIASFHNLYPHNFAHSIGYHRLYEIVYDRCSVIHHFSRTSYEMAAREYPVIATKRNVVFTGFNYEWLVRPDANRAKVRAELGIENHEFVVLVMGAVRRWREARLIMNGFSGAHVPNKRLMNLTTVAPSLYHSRYIAQRAAWKLWRRRQHAIEAYRPPDQELYRYFEAADAVVVGRLESLSSGVLALGMTFGKIIIAPDTGAMPEYLAGTENLLYKAGDAKDLARAIERAASLDFAAVSATNRRIAAGWNWETIIGKCLKEVGL